MSYTKQCAYCGTEFSTDQSTKIYCSRRCNDLTQAQRHQERRIAESETQIKDCTCVVCGQRYRTSNVQIVTCSKPCSAIRRKKTKNLARHKTGFDDAADKPLRSATNCVYSDDMVGKTIVRTTTRGNFVGLPVVVLNYQRLMIGDKPTTIQHSANAWVGSISGEHAQIIGPRIDFSVPISDIERI